MYQDNPDLLNTTAMTKENGFKDAFHVFSGNVIYDEHIESTVWVRHANQSQSSHLPETKSNSTLPLDILLDTASSMSPDIPKDNPRTSPKRVLGISYRLPKKPYQLQINSQNKSYDQKAKKGTC